MREEASPMEARTTAAPTGARPAGAGDRIRRLTTETKQAFKTSEFWAYVVVSAAILVSAAVIKGGDTDPGTDEFIASQAWLYVAVLTGLYIVGRGIAKSGSRDPYTESTDSDNGHRH
jgi:hypothetical protein